MEQLSIIITEKKNLGYVAIPFIVSFENEPAITLVEQVLPSHLKEGKYSFTGIEKEIIESLYKINEQAIFKQFSRDKTLKSFFDNLTEENIEKYIKPYIEKHITKAFELIAASNVPAFIKRITYSNLYRSDQVVIGAEYSKAVFNFILTDEGLSYTLAISEENEKISVLKKDIEEITCNPAALIINHHLYRFENIDSKKFRPFTSKEEIKVPANLVEKYMTTFVENCVRDHEVSASGFDIKNKEVSRKAVLSLEHGLDMQSILMLMFKYDDRKYEAGGSSAVFVDTKIENGRYVLYKFKRDKRWESEVASLLKSMELTNSVSSSIFIPEVRRDDVMIYNIMEWINENSQLLAENDIELIQNDKKVVYYTKEVELKITRTAREDWFDIYAEVIVGEYKIPFIKFRHNIINGLREYKLPNGLIFIIPQQWFTNFSDLMQFGKVIGDNIQLDKMHFSLIPEDDDAPASESWNSKIGEMANFINEENPEQPKNINAVMRPYQLEGYGWMTRLHKYGLGGILADDMGLGKTLQTIALLANVYDNQNNKEDNTINGDQPMVQGSLFDNQIQGFNRTNLPASIIVMPTSLIHNWHSEISRFAPQLKVYHYIGNSRIKSNEIGRILRHYHVVLTTYGILRNDIEYLSKYDFLYQILDESQNIKNPTSKIYYAVSEIKAAHRLVLSGTPIENSLTDLWAQMSFVNRGLLGNLNFFKNHFDIPINKNKDEAKELKLKKLISPFILRRTKEMVAKDLPPITEQILYCDMTPEQKQVYNREKSGIRNEVMRNFENAKLNQASFMALQALTRLRLIANHPKLANPDYEGSSGKFEQILEHIDNIISDKHKLLIFSSFVKDIELIEQQLVVRGYNYSKLTGATTDRQKVISKFTDDDDCKIFLISLKAGGVGLNLTQADYVFVLNPWWNPAAEAQAINRAHRIGQTKNVFVYKFITTESIEEKILRLQEKKLLLADNFITADNPLKDLTTEEIKELFD